MSLRAMHPTHPIRPKKCLDNSRTIGVHKLCPGTFYYFVMNLIADRADQGGGGGSGGQDPSPFWGTTKNVALLQDSLHCEWDCGVGRSTASPCLVPYLVLHIS